MPTRKEILIELAQLAVLERIRYTYSAVVLPTYEEVRCFSRDFYKLLDEVSEWLKPAKILKEPQRFTCEYCSIVFVTSPDALRGHTINSLYYSLRLGTEVRNTLREKIYPAMRDFECYVGFSDDYVRKIEEQILPYPYTYKLPYFGVGQEAFDKVEEWCKNRGEIK